jgi:hypothetical protein
MHSDFFLPAWDSLPSGRREELAAWVCRIRPQFRLESVELQSQGSQAHYVAFYSFGGSMYALVPGAEATLGHDPDRPWLPTQEELEDWERFAAGEPNHPGPLAKYIAGLRTGPRVVHIEPFLLEVAATVIGRREVQQGDPLFDATLARILVPGRGEIIQTGVGWRVKYRADRSGAVRAFEHTPVSHADAAEGVRRSGFRLCTSDEWEYACAAGARTLFRWGDRFPPIAYEQELDPWEGFRDADFLSDPELMKQYLVHLQNDPTRQPFRNPSVGPNAYGLAMPENFAEYPEYCAEAGVLRGARDRNLIERFYAPHFEWLHTAPSYYVPRPPEWTQLALGPIAIRRAMSVEIDAPE